MDIKYKLVTQDYKTRKGHSNETDWSDNSWKSAAGDGGLCSSGVLHAYDSPEIALFLNPIHAQINSPRMLEVECNGLVDWKPTKVGYKKMRRVKEIFYNKPTRTQRIAFSILCAKKVYFEPDFVVWANSWLSGMDRTSASAAAQFDANAAYEVALTSIAAPVSGGLAARAAILAVRAATLASSHSFAAEVAAMNTAAFAAEHAMVSLDADIIKDFSLIDLALEAMKY